MLIVVAIMNFTIIATWGSNGNIRKDNNGNLQGTLLLNYYGLFIIYKAMVNGSYIDTRTTLVSDTELLVDFPTSNSFMKNIQFIITISENLGITTGEQRDFPNSCAGTTFWTRGGDGSATLTATVKFTRLPEFPVFGNFLPPPSIESGQIVFTGSPITPVPPPFPAYPYVTQDVNVQSTATTTISINAKSATAIITIPKGNTTIVFANAVAHNCNYNVKAIIEVTNTKATIMLGDYTNKSALYTLNVFVTGNGVLSPSKENCVTYMGDGEAELKIIQSTFASNKRFTCKTDDNKMLTYTCTYT